jgi:hypothetical protein
MYDVSGRPPSQQGAADFPFDKVFAFRRRVFALVDAAAKKGTDCPTGGQIMGQLIVSWFIDDGRFRVHAINAVGRRKGRIFEVEELDTGERFHGSARRLDRLVRTLRSSSGDLDQASPWKRDTPS